MAKHRKKDVSLPRTFSPKFLVDVDGRSGFVKEIRRRLDALVADTGCDSYQKKLLATEAIFISIQLETMRSNAIEGKDLDAGVYTQMVNALSGLLTKLGLDRQLPKTLDLKTYVGGRR